MKTSLFDMTFTLPPLVEMTQVEKEMHITFYWTFRLPCQPVVRRPTWKHLSLIWTLYCRHWFIRLLWRRKSPINFPVPLFLLCNVLLSHNVVIGLNHPSLIWDRYSQPQMQIALLRLMVVGSLGYFVRRPIWKHHSLIWTLYCRHWWRWVKWWRIYPVSSLPRETGTPRAINNNF